MRTSLHSLSISAFVATAITATSGRAEPAYAWCAISSTGGLGQPLCHFATRDQCTAFLSGLSGTCQPNARGAAQAPTGKRGAR